MAGSKNNTHYSAGYNLYPVTSGDIVTMQYETDATQIINVDGTPEGNEAANPGSLACDRTNGDIYKKSSGTGNTGWELLSTTTGTGDVVGPATATDNAVVRYDGTTGKLIQNSVGILTDAGALSGLTQLDVDNLRLDGNTLSSTNTNGSINLIPDGSGAVSFTTSKVAGFVSYIAKNTDNTSDDSAAVYEAITGGASGGDPYFVCGVDSTRSYCFGIDNSDSDNLKIATTNSSLTNPSDGTLLWSMTESGERTMPLQPAFSARLGSSTTDITGDGTAVNLGGNTAALTEIFDQGGDFTVGDGAGAAATFTAPVTGRYLLGMCVLLAQMVTATNGAILTLTTSNRIYRFGDQGTTATGNFPMAFSVFADMDANDTATFSCTASGGTAIVDVYGGADSRTFVWGQLSC